jgi:hypothetical protein
MPELQPRTVLAGARSNMLCMVLGMIILCIVPGIATWLPEALMGPAL